MNFLEFTNTFGSNTVIDIRNVLTYFNGLDRRRLYEWQKKGYLIKLASNFYLLAGKPVTDDVLREAACRIYHPAYVGLESALAYYNLIPEAVFQTVGVTPRRAKTISSPVGDFRFRSIKTALFFGYNAVDAGNTRFWISDPEKTVLDALYFREGSDKKATLQEMRLNPSQLRQRLDPRKLKTYLRLFASPKLDKAAQILMEMADVKL